MAVTTLDTQQEQLKLADAVLPPAEQEPVQIFDETLSTNEVLSLFGIQQTTNNLGSAGNHNTAVAKNDGVITSVDPSSLSQSPVTTTQQIGQPIQTPETVPDVELVEIVAAELFSDLLEDPNLQCEIADTGTDSIVEESIPGARFETSLQIDDTNRNVIVEISQPADFQFEVRILNASDETELQRFNYVIQRTDDGQLMLAIPDRVLHNHDESQRAEQFNRVRAAVFNEWNSSTRTQALAQETQQEIVSIFADNDLLSINGTTVQFTPSGLLLAGQNGGTTILEHTEFDPYTAAANSTEVTQQARINADGNITAELAIFDQNNQPYLTPGDSNIHEVLFSEKTAEYNQFTRELVSENLGTDTDGIVRARTQYGMIQGQLTEFRLNFLENGYNLEMSSVQFQDGDFEREVLVTTTFGPSGNFIQQEIEKEGDPVAEHIVANQLGVNGFNELAPTLMWDRVTLGNTNYYVSSILRPDGNTSIVVSATPLFATADTVINDFEVIQEAIAVGTYDSSSQQINVDEVRDGISDEAAEALLTIAPMFLSSKPRVNNKQ